MPLRLRTVAMVAMVLVIGARTAYCWEFTLSGEYENRIRWFSRMGDKDLFGNAALQEGAVGGVLVGFSGPITANKGALPTVPAPSSNFFINLGSTTGRQLLITRGGFSSSGSAALYNDSRLTLYPGVRIHDAARLGAVLNFGGYRNKYYQNAAFGDQGQGIPPFERYYVSQASNNAYDTLGLISIEQFWAKVELPWGSVSMGPRAFPFGTGATLGLNTRSEMYLLVVPYGPFRFMYGIWPASVRIPSIWANVPDADLKNNVSQGFFITYDASSFSIGAGTIHRQFHGNNLVPFMPNLDDNRLMNIVFLKYMGSRFFANVEYAWLNEDRYRSLLIDEATVERATLSQTMYTEAYHFFAEAGVMAGPFKLSLMSAIASGPVLNNNNRMRNVPAGGFFLAGFTPAPYQRGLNPKVYVPWAINYQALAPYEFLMFNTFAGGNNGGWNALDFSFVADEHGMMTDAYCFAVRLDHTVAANLNLWGSYLWAHRLEQAGTYFGQYQSSGSLVSGSIPNVMRFYDDAGRAFGVGADYVSNGFIGWEVNVGIDWKLLEGVTCHARYSLWEPGDYFREAYQAVVVDRYGAVVTTGVLHARDKISAFQSTVNLTF